MKKRFYLPVCFFGMAWLGILISDKVRNLTVPLCGILDFPILTFKMINPAIPFVEL